MRGSFFLFQSHLDFAFQQWKALLQPGDRVIDATCGNGHDAAKLAELKAELFCIDLQPAAINATKELLSGYPAQFFCGSHENFPESIEKESVRLIVYNLGYLPGSNKEIKTDKESTLKSVKAALELIAPGGAISITCYPGHPEGAEEEERLLEELKKLPPQKWAITHQRWVNRNRAPSFLLIQKQEQKHL